MPDTPAGPQNPRPPSPPSPTAAVDDDPTGLPLALTGAAAAPDVDVKVRRRGHDDIDPPDEAA